MSRTRRLRRGVLVAVAGVTGFAGGAALAASSESKPDIDVSQTAGADEESIKAALEVEAQRALGFDYVPYDAKGALGRVFFDEFGSGPGRTNVVRAFDSDDIVAYEVPGVGFVPVDRVDELSDAKTPADAGRVALGTQAFDELRAKAEAVAAKHLAEAKAQGKPIDQCVVAEDFSITCK